VSWWLNSKRHVTDALPLENQGAVKEVWMVHVRVCALDGGAEVVAHGSADDGRQAV